MVDLPTPAIAVDADALARVGVALADPTRRALLLRLVAGPAFPADLAELLGVGRTNVSNHLSCLRGCGLVSAEPVGRRVRYSLADPRLGEALAALASLVLVTTAAESTCGPADYDCEHGDHDREDDHEDDLDGVTTGTALAPQVETTRG
ncbi:hypothetical protein GCM10009593_21680 [Microlunatus antarcticus]